MKRVGLVGNIIDIDGLGGLNIRILTALYNLGIPTRCIPLRQNVYGDLPYEVLRQMEHTFQPTLDIVHTIPSDIQYSTAPRKIMWTQWHTTELPNNEEFGDMAGIINSCDRCIVPAQYCKELYQASGITVPIEVINYAIDTERFPYIDRPARDHFTVLLYGRLTATKNPFAALAAFQRAFPSNDDVSLILATHGGFFDSIRPVYSRPTFRDSRIKILNKPLLNADILELTAQADCGIWLTHGEGFGLPPLEMAARGLPVVISQHTGALEFFRPDCFYGVEADGLVDSPYGGQWYEANIEQAADHLRRIYDDRAAAKETGRRAAAHVRAGWSMEPFQERIGAYLDSLGDEYD